VPFLHFFDGFRTSHEVNKIEQLDDDQIRAMIDDDLVRAPRARLTPDRPVLRGTAQNPDVYFQGARRSTPSTCLPENRAEGDGQIRQLTGASTTCLTTKARRCRARHRADGLRR
jgi:pyruvate-ferredoxin/flavodoxin oxidoreductase